MDDPAGIALTTRCACDAARHSCRFRAHRGIPKPGEPATDYGVFAGKLFRGRKYRQPVETAPDAGQFVPGLQIYLHPAGNVP